MVNFLKIIIGLFQLVSAIPIPPEPREYFSTSSGAPILPIDYLLEDLAMKHEGCCDSCGYKKCPSTNLCVRPWETYCQEFDFPYNILYQTAGIIIPPINKTNI
jgi:hypothetical protein